MIIRVAQLNDAPALARVIVDTGRAAHSSQVPEAALTNTPLTQAYAESERNWVQVLHQIAEADQPQECIYVAEDETGTVVGLVMGGPPRQEAFERIGEVYVLYVRESHQRRGLGRRLLQAVAADLAQRGRLTLWIGCLATNVPARRFYEEMGGRLIGERTIDQAGFKLPEVIYGWADTRALISGNRTAE
jgi:ribosomal protein S18 acetylase RimI-like enzyme